MSFKRGDRVMTTCGLHGNETDSGHVYLPPGSKGTIHRRDDDTGFLIQFDNHPGLRHIHGGPYWYATETSLEAISGTNQDYLQLLKED